MNTKPSRCLELDALRGMAALLVIFFHYTLGRPEAAYGFNLGTTGVDLFFMISGFVILMSLNKVKKSSDFIINRVSRLYPTYWAAVTFTFLLKTAITVYLNGKFTVTDFLQYIGNMTMFQFYLNIPDLDGPYWTMIVEMLFYITMASLFHFKLLEKLNIIGVSLSVFIVIIITCFPDNFFAKFLFKSIPLLQFIPLFIAGTLFYNLYTEGNVKLFERYLLIILCLIIQILLFKHSGLSFTLISQIQYATMLIIYFILFTLFVNGKLKFIVSAPSLFLGKISFALYLIHEFLSFHFLFPILVNKMHIDFWIASVAIVLPTTILIATFITYFIEIPFGKKVKEKLHTVFS